MTLGMPAGLASVTLQSHAFFSRLIAALVLGERPSGRQVAGGLSAAAGLAVIGSSAGTGGFTLTGLLLTIAAAVSWAMGNVLLRSSGKVDMLPAVVWLSLVSALPLFGLSLVVEGPQAVNLALASVSWTGVASVVYIAFIATVIGFGGWGHLLKLYPVSTVAPFSLLVPVFGTVAAATLLGEQFPAQRLAGMGLIAAGMAILAMPTQWLRFGFAGKSNKG